MDSQKHTLHKSQQQQLDNLYNNIPQSIIANFHTHLSEYDIGASTQIDISTQLDEDALNKIIKEILQSTIDQQTIDKINFDFLVNGKLLRGKLKSHLVRYQIKGQQIIKIQYFIAFREFQSIRQSPVQDWISCISQVIGLDTNIGIMSALFNGSVAFHDKISKKQSKHTHKVNESIIKCVKTMPSEIQNIYYIITGGIDQELNISKFSIQTPIQVISINQHQGPIFAIDINPSLDGHLCSAGAQGSLNIWKLNQNFLSDESAQVKTQKKKKKKTNKKNLPFIASENLHKDAINSVCWLSSEIVATGSSDHSLKLTNVEKMKQNRTFLTKDSITTSIDYSNQILFTSHQDGYIRTWDLRSNNTNPLQTYKSHARFSSCVRSQTRSNIFASSSYDQTVKVWDTRSAFPLQTISTNYDKIFTLCWKSQKQIVSGGSSPFITFHSIQ